MSKNSPKILNCKFCGKIFQTTHWKKLTCSKNCAKKHHDLWASADWRKSHKLSKKNCVTCGIEFETGRARILNCSKQCAIAYSKSQTKKKSRFWFSERMKNPKFRTSYNLKARNKKRKRDAIKDGADIGNLKILQDWESVWRSESHAKCFWCLNIFKVKDCHVVSLAVIAI